MSQLVSSQWWVVGRVVGGRRVVVGGPGGFDAARDIAGITVNRWGHGYSYSGDPLLEERLAAPAPSEIARTRLGQVAIANSDAAWTPFAHVAIDQAHRAVGELLDDA